MCDCITVVIRLPKDKQLRSNVLNSLRLGSTFEGGSITAMSCENEITKVEQYEMLVGDLSQAQNIVDIYLPD
ncbi:MAG: hypothetical protein V3W04_06585 [Gammaproteobacteria bacterium]